VGAWERGRLVSRVGGGEKAKNGLVDEKTMEVEERANGSKSSGSGGEGRHVKFWLGEVLERMARNVSGPKRRDKSEAS
jgi:hypothetical protein